MVACGGGTGVPPFVHVDLWSTTPDTYGTLMGRPDRDPVKLSLLFSASNSYRPSRTRQTNFGLEFTRALQRQRWFWWFTSFKNRLLELIGRAPEHVKTIPSISVFEVCCALLLLQQHTEAIRARS